MTKISGVVDAVSAPKDIRTAKGVFKKVGFKLGDVWYNHFGKSVPAVSRGDSVTFEAKEGDYGWDIDPKTLAVAAAEGQPAPRTGDARAPVAPGSVSATEKQIRVSHGINVAVQALGPLSGDADEDLETAYLKAVESLAKRIVRLSQHMVANYEAIAGTKAPAPPKAAPKKAPEPPAEEQAFDDDEPF